MTLTPLPGIYSPESLRSYLLRFASSSIVGKRKCSGGCTLARWFKAVFGLVVIVSGSHITINGIDYSIDGWPRRFLCHHDAGNRQHVKAAEALAALDAAVKESA